MLPYIYGERSPIQDPLAQGILFGLKGSHGRKEINRAALEAVGYSVYQHLLLFSEMGVPPETIITAGGGTRNLTWMHIVCDMAGMPVHIPETYQCSSFGDAMMAAIGAGVLENFHDLREALPEGRVLQPDAENHKYYQEHYEIYKQLYLKNKDLMHLNRN
jgi:xylulokinase